MNDSRNDVTSDVSRRDFVATLTALGAVWMTAAGCNKESAPPKVDSVAAAPKMADSAAPPQTLVHFSVEQAKEIDAIASRILPTDDSPGAHEAGVVYFIDRTMTTFAKGQAPLFDDGLKALAKNVKSKHGATATFSSLTPVDQDAELKRIEKTPFFGAIRFATIAGFLALPRYGGNKDFIGWKYIGQDNVMENKAPFGWYDRPENQQALLGRVI